MASYDLLSDWLCSREREVPLELLARSQAETRVTLGRLEKLLDDLSAGGPEPAMMSCRFGSPGGLPLSEIPRAHDLYRRLVDTGVRDTEATAVSLLRLVADTESDASIPFWLGVLDRQRAGDPFSVACCEMALAALARLAIGRRLPEAYDALNAAAHHSDADVRAVALHYLRRAYADSGSVLPSAVCDDLLDIALSDEHFAPRYQARLGLQLADLPLPLDNVGGSYGLALRSGPHECDGYGIEMRSEQTLDDLHRAIRYVLDWGAVPHCSFHMCGRPWDDDYTICCAAGAEGPRRADETLIGELGLLLNHTFFYLRGYGRSDHCEIEVVDIHPEAGPGSYPRILGVGGEPLPQVRL